MSLHLYMHPFAAFCQKALIAFYENDTPFVPHFIDLGDAAQRAELAALWPLCKFPVLRDEGRGEVVPESSIIIEYLAQRFPGPCALVPKDADRARATRLADRFYDHYVAEPMQKIVGDRLRPTLHHDRHGVAEAQRMLRTAYAMIDRDMRDRTWAIGDEFTMADCAAAPALYYADMVVPLADFPQAAAYRTRLMARASYARVLREASPYAHLFPADAGG